MKPKTLRDIFDKLISDREADIHPNSINKDSKFGDITSGELRAIADLLDEYESNDS